MGIKVSKKIKTQILSLPAIALLCIFVLYLTDKTVNDRISNKVIIPEFENAILTGNKMALKSATDAEIALICDAIKETGAKDVDSLREIAKKYTDSVRFMDDKSGILFHF